MDRPPLSTAIADAPIPFPIFVDTSLDTHLAVVVSPDDTVHELKGKVMIEHASGFPETGDITILAMKVKRRGALYRLSESMKVRDAFVGTKGSRFLYVDATRSIDIKNSALRSLIDAVALEAEKPSKSCMLQHESDAKNAANSDQDEVRQSGFQATECEQPIPVENKRSKKVKMTKKDSGHPFEGSSAERREGSRESLAKLDLNITDNGKNGAHENLPFGGMEQHTEPSLPLNIHGKRIMDSTENKKDTVHMEQKKHKKLKGVSTAECHAKSRFEVGDHNLEKTKETHELMGSQNTFEGHGVEPEYEVGKSLEKIGKKGSKRPKGKDSVEYGAGTGVESHGLEPRPEKLMEMEFQHIGSQESAEGAYNELADEAGKPDGSYGKTLATEKKRRRKSKGKECVENGVFNHTKLPEDNSNVCRPDLEPVTEKAPGHSGHREDIGVDVGDFIDQPLRFNKQNECLPLKKTTQIKRRKKHHKVSDEAVAVMEETPAVSDTLLFAVDKTLNSGEAFIDPSRNAEKEPIIGEKSKRENIKVSEKDFNLPVDEVDLQKFNSPEGVETKMQLNDKVKKPRHKKSSDARIAAAVASTKYEIAPNVQIQTSDDHHSTALVDNHSLEKSDMMSVNGESNQNMVTADSNADLMKSSTAQSSHPNEKPTDFIVGLSLDSPNENADAISLPGNSNSSIEESAAKPGKELEVLAMDVADEIIANVDHGVPKDSKSKPKQQKKQKRTENLKDQASNVENNYYLEEHPSSGNPVGDVSGLPLNNEATQNLLSENTRDFGNNEATQNLLSENLRDDCEKYDSGSRKKSRPSKKKIPKTLEPENFDCHGLGTPLFEKQADEVGPREAINYGIHFSSQVTEDIKKQPVGSTAASEITPEVLIPHHRKKSAKTDGCSQTSTDVDAANTSEHLIKLSENALCEPENNQESDRKQPMDFGNTGMEDADPSKSFAKKTHRDKRKVENQNLKLSKPKLNKPEVADFKRKESLEEHQDVTRLEFLNEPEVANACGYDGSLASAITSTAPPNGNVHCCQDGSEEPTIGKLGFHDTFLPKQDKPAFVTSEEGIVSEKANSGKQKKVDKNVRGRKKNNGASYQDSASILCSNDSSQKQNSKETSELEHADKCDEETKFVTSIGEKGKKERKSKPVPDLDGQKGVNKKNDDKEPDALPQNSNACLSAVQPEPGVPATTKEVAANLVASNDSTDDETPYNTQRYRVAVRKIPRGQLGVPTENSNKRILSASNKIFDDDSSSSSEGALHKTHEKTISNGPLSGSSTSSESDEDLDNIQSSQLSLTKVVDYRATTPTKRGIHGNDMHQPELAGHRLNLSAVLRNSSTYKKAKVLASKRHNKDDSESQPVDVVPETQSDDLAC